jgi:hypothetical protein
MTTRAETLDPSVRTLAVALGLFGLFALVGSLFMWGERGKHIGLPLRIRAGEKRNGGKAGGAEPRPYESRAVWVSCAGFYCGGKWHTITKATNL